MRLRAFGSLYEERHHKTEVVPDDTPRREEQKLENL